MKKGVHKEVIAIILLIFGKKYYGVFYIDKMNSMMYNFTKINRNLEVNDMLEFGAENEEVNQYSQLAPFVISVKDDIDNQLSIIIALPKHINSKPDYDDQRISKILSNATQVGADIDRMYEIRFETCIIYQCRNESYTSYVPNEIVRGKYLVIYEQSPLLDYYKNVISDKDYEKLNRKHYGIFSENHIIDVISNEPPIIAALN